MKGRPRLRVRRDGIPAEIRAAVTLPAGDRVLASARVADGSWLLGTRGNLVIVRPGDEGVRTIPWESVEDAAWDGDGERLRVSEVADYGQPKPSYTFEMEEPARLLQLLRERVTASIVLQRWVPVRAKRGLTLIARRSPLGGDLRWFHSYDSGLDPDDPVVRRVAEAALEQGLAEVGERPDDLREPTQSC